MHIISVFSCKTIIRLKDVYVLRHKSAQKRINRKIYWELLTVNNLLKATLHPVQQVLLVRHAALPVCGLPTAVY